MTRKLDNRRLGLLLNMLGFRTLVCRKSTAGPLVKRGYFSQMRKHSYELTHAGRAFAKKEYKRLLADHPDGVQIVTWGGISIGSAVLMLADSPKAEKQKANREGR